MMNVMNNQVINPALGQCVVIAVRYTLMIMMIWYSNWHFCLISNISPGD